MQMHRQLHIMLKAGVGGSDLVSTFLSVLPLLLSINLTPFNEQVYSKSVKMAKHEAVQHRGKGAV